jgi:hypothetical protein
MEMRLLADNNARNHIFILQLFHNVDVSVPTNLCFFFFTMTDSKIDWPRQHCKIVIE